MKSPAVDITSLLEDSSIGLTSGTDLFASIMPDSPDACVSVYDTGGIEPDIGADLYYPTFQVRIRGSRGDYQTSRNLSESILQFLHKKVVTVAGSAKYLAIFAVTDILFIARDEKDRPLFSINFRTMRTQTS